MASTTSIELVVVTPERQVLEETADAVVIPAHDGELGVLPERAPLMCELGIGQLRYQAHGQTHRMFIDGGFAQIHQNRVIVLTQDAAAAEDITDDMIANAEKAAGEITGNSPEDNEARIKHRRRAAVLRKLRS